MLCPPLKMEEGANTHWEWLGTAYSVHQVLCRYYPTHPTLSLLNTLHQRPIWCCSRWGSAGSFTLTKAWWYVTEPCLKSFPPKPTCTLSTMQHCLLSWKLIIISGSNSNIKSFLCARIKSKVLTASIIQELYLDLCIYLDCSYLLSCATSGTVARQAPLSMQTYKKPLSIR